jgi:uncharacterized protein DUF6312
MRDLRLSESVRRVIQIQPDPSGIAVPVVLYERSEPRRKKSTRVIRPFEKLVHRFAKSDQMRAAKYLERHERSNMKRRDGWARDFNVNVIRAFQSGGKPLRWDRWLRF